MSISSKWHKVSDHAIPSEQRIGGDIKDTGLIVTFSSTSFKESIKCDYYTCLNDFLLPDTKDF